MFWCVWVKLEYLAGSWAVDCSVHGTFPWAFLQQHLGLRNTSISPRPSTNFSPSSLLPSDLKETARDPQQLLLPQSSQPYWTHDSQFWKPWLTLRQQNGNGLLKLLSQLKHFKALAFQCELAGVWRLDDWVSLFPHMERVNGFSPV